MQIASTEHSSMNLGLAVDVDAAFDELTVSAFVLHLGSSCLVGEPMGPAIDVNEVTTEFAIASCSSRSHSTSFRSISFRFNSLKRLWRSSSAKICQKNRSFQSDRLGGKRSPGCFEKLEDMLNCKQYWMKPSMRRTANNNSRHRAKFV
uniref:Uncharacterized protein n=1 Tax=Glossina austeni TaxID=7395 RepID=A0A1A9V1Y4_GLOAU